VLGSGAWDWLYSKYIHCWVCVIYVLTCDLCMSAFICFYFSFPLCLVIWLYILSFFKFF
jgi:hypothetical protein